MRLVPPAAPCHLRTRQPLGRDGERDRKVIVTAVANAVDDFDYKIQSSMTGSTPVRSPSRSVRASTGIRGQRMQPRDSLYRRTLATRAKDYDAGGAPMAALVVGCTHSSDSTPTPDIDFAQADMLALLGPANACAD